MENQETKEQTAAPVAAYTGNGIRMQADAKMLDPETGMNDVVSWYEEAGKVDSMQSFQNLSERVLGAYNHTGGTSPHAHAVIALAALKLSNNSEQGQLSAPQAMFVMWSIVRHMCGLSADEPVRMMRVADYLMPDGASKYNKLDRISMDWLKTQATMALIDPDIDKAKMPPEMVNHLENLAKGVPPKGVSIGS